MDSIGVGLGVAEEAGHSFKGSDGRVGLDGREECGGREEKGVDNTGIVEEGADFLAKALGLSGGSRGGSVQGGYLWSRTTILGWDVEGGGGSVADTKGAKAFQHGGDVIGHGEGVKTTVTVMINGATKEGGGDGGSFDVVGLVEAGDHAMKVSYVVVLNTKVIFYKTKVDTVSMVG